MKKTILITVSTILLIILLTIVACAASTVATTDSKSCAQGGTVTLNVNVSNTSRVTSGSVEVIYDKNVLQLVDANWNVNGALLTNYDKATDLGAIAFSSPSNVGGNVFWVKFKVADNAPVGETTVSCNIILRENKTDLPVTNNSGKITITCNHDFSAKSNEHLASAATCTSPEKYYYTCSICGEKGSTTYTVGSALPHTFNKQVATSNYLVKSVKCVNEADYYYSCSCGAKGTEKFKADASWSHKYGDGWFISADGHWHQCIDCGAKKDFADHIKNSDGICSKCYFVIADDVHQHSFGSGWKKNDDAHWKECSCGLKDNLALHSWDAGKETKPATESQEGEKLYTCTDCRQTKIEKLDKLAHQHAFGNSWSKSEDAHWHVCSCGIKDGLALHNWDAGKETKPATESQEGEKLYTCTDCGQTKTEKLDKLQPAPHEHSFSKDWSKSEDAHWHQCSCGIKDGLALHNWDAGKETKPATESQEGEKLYTCTDCGQIKIEKIDKLKIEKPTGNTTPAPISKTKILIIAGAGIGALLVLEAIGFGIYCIVKRSKKLKAAAQEPSPTESEETEKSDEEDQVDEDIE